MTARPIQIPATAAELVTALEEAGATLLALPNTGHTTRLRQSGMEWARDAAQAYAPTNTPLRPAAPTSTAIDHMDVVLGWIPRIPIGRFVLRRVVGARCLMNPMTGRLLYSWRRLGTALGADHKAIQRWHAQGIAIILASLHTALPRPGTANALRTPIAAQPRQVPAAVPS